MAKFVSFILFVGFLTDIPHLVHSAPKNVTKIQKHTRGIEYIGSVDGKTFFAQISPTKTWNEARRFCLDNSMHLASVTSIQQRSLLVRAQNDGTFHGHFWTGGRDAQTQSQLVWDFDQTPLSNAIVAEYWHGAEISTCMTFYSKPDFADYVFDSFPCSEKHGVLCEIIHAE